MSLNEYRMLAQDFAWTNRAEIGATFVTLLSSIWGRRFWLGSQIYLAFVCHAIPMIFFPETCLSYVKLNSGNTDAVHIQLVQWIGILIFTQTLSFWLLSRSSDSATETPQLWAYTVHMGCMGIAKAFLYTYSSERSGATLHYRPLSLIPISLSFLINLFYALRSQDWAVNFEQVSQRNKYIHLDAILLLAFGVIWFAFPSLFLNCQIAAGSADDLHNFLCHIIGAFLFYHAIMSICSVSFNKDDEKDAVIFLHFIGYVMLFAVFAVRHIKNWEDVSLKNAALISAADILLIFNSFMAMNVDIDKYLTETLIPRVKQVPQDLHKILKAKTGFNTIFQHKIGHTWQLV
ncbi:hypothetical protein CHS0354_013575 [Potamilus streckersoni]|uniref:Transmembrane protein n=1 Tax=Potamilus streckersoni TaxID=2493646 RepID=A0AAE0SLN1_9BIVA|nr:hypothetical protein CHS0354_013575 [Potamilus streckersoni]